MAYENILVDVKDGVAKITLNRPEKLNAFNFGMGTELNASFAEFNDNDDVRVIVVTGAGRAFARAPSRALVVVERDLGHQCTVRGLV